jgi:hypothetical protein
MDLNQIFIFALACIVGALGWFARVLYDATQSLKSDVNDLRVLIATEFVRYDRMQDAMKPIMDSLQEIKQTLSTKADK